ncbi:MAG: LuxR family transcriptional regulator fused with ATPase domain [Actinomycetia bacterium]|nr:LuxR family transcriptional regulator fused with ATPase domain [Actinomycetes bacterium]
MSETGAAERFWLELQTLYQAADKPTLKQLVRLGRAQEPPIEIGYSTINGWLNSKAVPIGRKNERYLTAMVASLQARVGSDARYERLPSGEWGRLLRAAQAQRSAGKRKGRPRRPDISLRGVHALERQLPTHAPARVIPVAPRGPLVGRDSELALLAGIVKGIASGQGSAVLIEGEPGIGKSALVQAALAESASLGCQVFWGTGSELDQALPLQPLLDGLRVREPSPNTRREAVARFLRGEISTDRGMDGPAMLAEQLLALMTQECAVQPTILVIDDLQWADQASIRLLARLAGSVRQLPLLLVGMMRPVPQRDDLLALRRMAGDAVLLRLAGLTGAEAAELVECLAGSAPDGQLLRLADDAAGNPLYIIELVAALARSSRMTVTGGVATLTPGPAPRSLAAAIADRLGFISGSAREVLRSASLLGPEFAVTDLASLLGRGVADLAAILNEACAAGVLTESDNHLYLSFRHPLIHAALYGELPAPVRTAWHREAGRALAAADAPVDRVARQLLLAAGEPEGPPEPMDEWMLSWLAEAAEVLVTQAPQVAARLLTQAVARTPATSARRGPLASQLADALYRTGDKTTAEQVAIRELGHAVDPDVLVGLHWTLAQCRMAAGSFAETLAALDGVLAAPGLSMRHRARLLVLVARTHNSSGELGTAVQVARTALAAAEEARDPWAMAWALHTMAGAAVAQGRLADQLSLFDQGLAVTQAEPALIDLRLLLQINKAVALATLDRQEEALTIARQARQLADQAGATIRLAQAHCVLGQLLFETGRWDEGLAEMAVMPESLKEVGAVCTELGIAALISFHRGAAAAARGFLAAADPHAARIGRRFISPLELACSLDHEHAGALPAALSTLTRWLDGSTEEISQVQDILPDAVRLAMRIGDLGTAQALTMQAADFATPSETPFVQGNSLYCQGMLGHDAPLLLAAAEQYRRASRPLLRAKALEGAASAYARVGEAEQAQEALTSAAEIYGWLGASVAAARTQAAYGAANA